MKFKYRSFVRYCICALIILSSFTYGSACEKDISPIQIKEVEKPAKYEDFVSTLIDISEHIIDIDTLKNSMIREDPIYSIDINTLENPTELKGSVILPIIKKEKESEIDISNIEEKYKDEIPYIARTVWGEARGCSETEQAAVIWCILNRVDSSIRYMPDNIIDVVTQKHQFLGYVKTFPVTEKIRELVIDVLTRWEMEKAGVENVGRVLPPEYMWFHGDGRHNHFRDTYRGGNRWDWSLDSPYED